MDQPWVYIVLLGMVCIVISFLAPRSVISEKSNVVKEMEDTMEHFAAEIADENEQLLQSVAQMKGDHKQQLERLSAKIEQLEKYNYALSQDIKSIALHKFQQPIDIAPVKQLNAAQMQMKQRYSELFNMHEQGKSIEYIAKKLSLNKGEVLLIIQLAKQEELNRV